LGKGTARGAVSLVNFERKSPEDEVTVSGELLQVDEPFHNSHATGEQNLMYAGHLSQVVDVGDGRGLDPEDAHLFVNTPMG
jgi:ABC-type Fe2+-enterobactin transport system substrate-binding protein